MDIDDEVESFEDSVELLNASPQGTIPAFLIGN